nr:hypothetical protein [Tanacetum cinerariifolium]
VMVALPIHVSTEENLKDSIKIRVYVIHPTLGDEELTALRFRVDVAEAKNASQHATIRRMKAIEMVTRNHERLACIKIKRQLASV